MYSIDYPNGYLVIIIKNIGFIWYHCKLLVFDQSTLGRAQSISRWQQRPVNITYYCSPKVPDRQSRHMDLHVHVVRYRNSPHKSYDQNRWSLSRKARLTWDGELKCCKRTFKHTEELSKHVKLIHSLNCNMHKIKFVWFKSNIMWTTTNTLKHMYIIIARYSYMMVERSGKEACVESTGGGTSGRSARRPFVIKYNRKCLMKIILVLIVLLIAIAVGATVYIVIFMEVVSVFFAN